MPSLSLTLPFLRARIKYSTETTICIHVEVMLQINLAVDSMLYSILVQRKGKVIERSVVE